nr:MAG TPA: hypothetical protein [Bacteriophage sp.]
MYIRIIHITTILLRQYLTYCDMYYCSIVVWCIVWVLYNVSCKVL